MPLQPIEVSRLLAVPLETVSRWKAGRRSMDFAPWLVLATIALEKFEGPSSIVPRIQALRKAARSERTVDVQRANMRTVRELVDHLEQRAADHGVDVVPVSWRASS